MVSTMVSKTTSLSSSLSTPANKRDLEFCSKSFLFYSIFYIFLYVVFCFPLFSGFPIRFYGGYMNFFSYHFFKNFLFLIFVFLLFICIFFIPSIYSQDFNTQNQIGESFLLNPNGFIWPIPGYTKITSPFGKRKSPTSGASSSHSGIDIGAPEGTNLYAVCDGEITFTQFLGAGGYTITLSSKNLKITYCHVSPNYIVKKGDLVKQGQKIGNVGPKYVFGVPGNQYQDSSGKPTNGATTGTHLHFGIRVDGKYVDPLLYFK